MRRSTGGQGVVNVVPSGKLEMHGRLFAEGGEGEELTHGRESLGGAAAAGLSMSRRTAVHASLSHVVRLG